MQFSRAVAGAHAAYLLGSGAWSLVHRRSFEWVTGEKEDYWLVRTVGGLAMATGASLGLAVARGTRKPETAVLGVVTSVVFFLADLRAARSESRLYLADSVLQLVLAPAWLRAWEGDDRDRKRPRPRAALLRRRLREESAWSLGF